MRLRQKLQIELAHAYFNLMSVWERLRYGVGVNLLSPAFLHDPYPALNRLRETDPVHYSPALGGYWVTTFDQVQQVLREPCFGADARQFDWLLAQMKKGATPERLESIENPSMLSLDPPDHTRLRRLATHGFTFRYIQSLEPRIQQIMDRCLARAGNANVIDVVETIAKPLPAIVIAEMMGLPDSDHEQFQAWSEDLIGGTGINTAESAEKSQAASAALINYFKQIVVSRQDEPASDDLIAQLIGARESGDKLSAGELYNTCLLLLVAGHETTTRLIGNGLYNLLIRPEQLAWLRANPDRLGGAIEEMLRFEPPVLATTRFAREPMSFHGTSLKAGDQVFVSIAAANRDPAVNERPDEFDIRRDALKQVSFGYGIHHCIGAALARLEAKVVFATLLDRYPAIELVDNKPDWGDNPFFRGLERLPVQLQPDI